MNYKYHIQDEQIHYTLSNQYKQPIMLKISKHILSTQQQTFKNDYTFYKQADNSINNQKQNKMLKNTFCGVSMAAGGHNNRTIGGNNR